MTPVQAGLQISMFAMGVNLLLAACKTAAGFLGHSNALVADGIESVADVFSSLIVWGGLRLAVKPADPEHPYGHGKAEPIASVAVSLMLMGAAAVIAYRSMIAMQSSVQESPRWFTLPVLLAVIVIKETLYRRVLRTSRQLDSLALRSDAWHHRSDALTSAVAAFGITIALIGGRAFARADSWAALVACLVIVWNALQLLRVALNEVMDASVSPDILKQVKALSAQVAGVAAVEKCRIRKSGLHLAVDIHVMVDGSLTVRRGHEIAHEVKDRLLASPLRINDVTVHIEPVDA